MDSDVKAQGPDGSGGVTRRTVLVRGAQGALALSAVSWLAACGSGSSTTTKALLNTSGGGKPVRGGTLTVGGISGGATESLNPIVAYSNSDVVRAFQLYDTLFLTTPDLKSIEPRLATSAESNSDASVWTVKLRPGVTFHDGKPFTADDVIYSIKANWANPQGQNAAAAALIKLNQLRKIDDLTVEVPLVAPDAQWPATTTTFAAAIIQDGADLSAFNTHPIGTGPFEFVSFQQGRRSVFKANPNYWESGRPYLDQLVFDTSFTDDDARLNALLGGQIDLMPQSPFVVARNQLSNGEVTVFGSPSNQPYAFAMRVDQGPMADVRVRQAMKLVADREALIEGALVGYGTVGNDLLGEGCQYFDRSAKRVQDIEKAKSLLKAAGRDGETFTLQTSNTTAGAVESATLFAQQANAAGINVKLVQESPSVYYTPSGGYLSDPFRFTAYIPFGSLDSAYYGLLSKGASINETHWGYQPGGTAAWALLDKARAETNPARAQELWHEVQAQQFNEGGLLIWANADFVNLARPEAKGVTEARVGFLNNGRLRDAWVDRG